MPGGNQFSAPRVSDTVHLYSRVPQRISCPKDNKRLYWLTTARTWTSFTRMRVLHAVERKGSMQKMKRKRVMSYSAKTPRIIIIDSFGGRYLPLFGLHPNRWHAALWNYSSGEWLKKPWYSGAWVCNSAYLPTGQYLPWTIYTGDRLWEENIYYHNHMNLIWCSHGCKCAMLVTDGKNPLPIHRQSSKTWNNRFNWTDMLLFWQNKWFHIYHSSENKVEKHGDNLW